MMSRIAESSPADSCSTLISKFESHNEVLDGGFSEKECSISVDIAFSNQSLRGPTLLSGRSHPLLRWLQVRRKFISGHGRIVGAIQNPKDVRAICTLSSLSKEIFRPQRCKLFRNGNIDKLVQRNAFHRGCLP